MQHSIAHPLVLGLGLPETDFSRREGIVWSDAAGWELAKRVNPQVPYLGPEYERALFEYYASLWRNNPREVFDVYLTKARVAGKQMLAVRRGQPGREGQLVRWLLAPLDLLPSGLFILAVYSLVLGGVAIPAWRGSLAALVFLYLGVAAVLLHLESVAIMSLYAPQYHAYLVFYCLFLSVAGLLYLMSIVLKLIATGEPRAGR